MNNPERKEFKFKPGQFVYDTTGAEPSRQILIIREQYRDWDLSALHTDNPKVKNMYVVGEYGRSLDCEGPGSAMHYNECNLRPWTLDDITPGEIYTRKISKDNVLVGIVRSYDKTTGVITMAVYAENHSPTAVIDEDKLFRVDEFLPASVYDKIMLLEKMNSSNIEYNQKTMTVKTIKSKGKSNKNKH